MARRESQEEKHMRGAQAYGRIEAATIRARHARENDQPWLVDEEHEVINDQLSKHGDALKSLFEE